MKHWQILIDEHIGKLASDTGRVWTYGTTGGNCDAYFSSDTDSDNYFMITCEASAPITVEEWESVTMGYYGEHNDHCPDSHIYGNYETIVSFFKNGDKL